jgi:hypothetical protein
MVHKVTNAVAPSMAENKFRRSALQTDWSMRVMIGDAGEPKFVWQDKSYE